MDPLKVTRAALEVLRVDRRPDHHDGDGDRRGDRGQPRGDHAPGFGDLAEGIVRPSNIY